MKTTLFIFFALLCVSPSLAQPLCDFKGRDSLFVTVQQDTIYLWDMDACAYCSAKFGVSVTLRSDTIFVTQTDTAGQISTCDCLFNLRASIAGLPRGTYWIAVHRDLLKKYGYPFDTLKHVGTLQCRYEPANSPGLSWNSFQSECIVNGPSQAYYPLAVGNRWDYGYLDAPQHVGFVYSHSATILRDTVMSNGKRYAVYQNLGRTSYLRHEGAKVYAWADTGETVSLNFDVQGVDTVSISVYGSDTIMTTVGAGSRTLFGRLLRTWTFSTKSLNNPFFESGWWQYADSIGYSESFQSPGEQEYLIGAVIDGVTYGTVSGVDAARDFYPLEIGNRWNCHLAYSYGYGAPFDTGNVEVSVTGDTLLPNGKVYRRLSFPDVLGATLVRSDSNYVYYYSPYDSGEVPMYNLRAPAGTRDSIRWGRGDISFSVVVGVAVSPVFGVQRTSRTYALGGLQQYNVTLTEGIGIRYAENLGDGGFPYTTTWSLRGAVIRDTVYGLVSGVNGEERLPAAFALFQNYPNPFNPSTTIRYALPHRSHVTLLVYNMLGQQVATLVNGEVEAGYHEVPFNAGTQASGVYFYRLQAGGYVQTKKLCLIR